MLERKLYRLLVSFLQMHTAELTLTVCFRVRGALLLPQAQSSQESLSKAHQEHLPAMVRPFMICE